MNQFLSQVLDDFRGLFGIAQVFKDHAFAMFARTKKKGVQALVGKPGERFPIRLVNVLIEVILVGCTLIFVFQEFFDSIGCDRSVCLGFGKDLGKNSSRWHLEIKPRRVEYVGKRTCDSVIMQKNKQ